MMQDSKRGAVIVIVAAVRATSTALRLFVSLFLFICLFVCLVCLSVCLVSVCLSVCLSSCLFICKYACVRCYYLSDAPVDNDNAVTSTRARGRRKRGMGAHEQGVTYSHGVGAVEWQ